MMTTKIITSIIGAFFQSMAATCILKSEAPEFTKGKLIKINVLIFIVDVICSLFVPNNLRFVYSTIVIILLLYFFFKITNKKSILYSFGIILILTISEIIITLGMVIVGIKSNILIENVYYNLLANILISLLSIGISKLPFIRIMFLKIINFFDKNKKSIYYFIFCLFIMYFIILKNGFELLFKSNYYINLIILIGILALFVIIMFNDIKSDQLKEINKQSLNYIRKYEKIITDQGKANHEFKNQIMVIRGYAQMKSPKLIEYLDSIIEDTKNTKSTYLISQLNRFPDGGIKGLLYYKLSIMEEKNIKFNIYCDESVKRKAKNLTSDQMKNVTKILGVLLDNAIDECNNVNDKVIDISLVGKRGKLLFNISNPIIDDKNVKKFGTGFTTKGKGHGYGLQLVKDIIETNEYIDYECEILSQSYVTTLIIKTGTKKTYKI